MSSFCCPICDKPFDEKNKIPRIVDCGHTFCSPCLEDLIKGSTDGNLICPEDEEQLTNYRPEKGVNSFSINKVLLKHKQTPKSKPVLKEAGTRISNMQSLNICLRHNKMREIVCQTEALVICPDCACTTEHKNHDLLNNENFLSFIRQLTSDLKNEIENVSKEPFFNDSSERLTKLEETMKTRKNELFAELSKTFDDMQGILFQRQKDLTLELESQFLEITSSLNAFREKVTDWEGRKFEWLKKNDGLNNFVQQTEIDYVGTVESSCRHPNMEETLKALVSDCKMMTEQSEGELITQMQRIKIVVTSADLMSFLTSKVSIINKGSQKENPQLKTESQTENLEGKSTEQVYEASIGKADNKVLTPNKSISFLNPKKAKNSFQIFPTTVSDTNTPLNNQKISFLNNQQPIKKGATSDLENAPKNTDLLDISNDDLNVSVSALASDSNKSRANPESKSLLDDDIDSSDLSALNISQSDKKRGEKKSLLTKKYKNNSFIKTRDGSSNEDQKRDKMAKSQYKNHTQETKQAQEPKSNKRLISSKSNNEILGAAVDSKLKRLVPDLKVQQSALNLMPFQLPNEPLNFEVSESPASRIGTPLLPFNQGPNYDFLNERQTNLLDPQPVSEAPVSKPTVRVLPDKNRYASNTEFEFKSKASLVQSNIVPERQTLQPAKRGETISLGSAPGLQGPSSLKPKISTKLGSIEETSNEINLSGRLLNDSNVSTQFSDILKNKKVKVLNLSNNFITDAGVGLILKNLAHHPTLEKLILRENFIGTDVFKIIKGYVSSLKKLKHFDMLENKEKIDRTVMKNEVANLRKANIIVEISSK